MTGARKRYPRTLSNITAYFHPPTVEAHDVTVDSIIVNHVMAACDCDYCRRRAASQKGYIEEIRAKFGEKQIALLPSYGEEVKGPGLDQVARDLYEKGQVKL